MTTALLAISLYRDTKAINNPRERTMSNDLMNALYEGLFDENGILGDKGDSI